MTTRPRTWIASSAAALLALLASVALPSSALAEDAQADAVSWSVSPADSTGADGRVAIEHELDPGESVEEHVLVRNLGAGDVVFSLSAADGFYTEAGRFDMLASDQESTGAGTWIAIPDDVEIPAGGSAVIPFTVTVPENAEPGDHAAGVAASVMSVKTDDSGTTGVGVESRVGVKVITRVAGAITPAFTVGGVQTDFRVDANPFEAGELTVTFDVQNTGNARMDAAGTLSIAGQQVAFPAEGQRPQVLLPGETRSFTLAMTGVWPLVLLSGDLTVAPVAASLDGETLAVASSTTPVTVWAMPWPQLLVVAGVALLVFALLWNRIRSRRRVEDLISQAVERGREEALALPDHGREKIAG
ncbi:COG1470 family protein [Microbacterium saperdae]